MRGRIVYHRSGEPTCYLEGQQVSREEFDEAFPSKPLDEPPLLGGNTPSAWPMLSDAAAVHPSQIEEAMESAKHRGVPTEFNPEDGRPIFTDRGHRRQYLKAYGFHDNQGGYGD